MEIYKNIQTKERDHGTRRRLVVKIGSSTVCDPRGVVRAGLLESFASQTQELKMQGVDTLFVSSGAVAVGRVVAPEVENKKLLSDIGQSWLAMAWNRAFYPNPVAQLLFTNEQLHDPTYLKQQIGTTLNHSIVPVINALNPDTNNDFTGTKIAQAVDADIFALLTTTKGVFKGDKPISLVSNWDDLTDSITDSVSSFGNGGMKPKCNAALDFVSSSDNGHAFIAHGLEERILYKLIEGNASGTKFVQV